MSAERMEFGGRVSKLSPLQCEIRSGKGFNLLKFVPENPISQIPVVLAPGFHAGAESYELLIRSLCTQGFTVIATNYQPEAVGQPMKWGRVPDVDTVKREAIHGAIDFAGAEKVHFIGHSKAAIEGVPIIAEHPEKFASCVLIAPRGILKKRNSIGAIVDLVIGEYRNTQGKKELKKNYPELKTTLADIKEAEKIYSLGLRDPRYFVEVISSAKQTIQGYFRKIREKGVKIVVVAQAYDGYYPVEQFEHILDSEDAPVDEFRVVEGTYGGIHGAIKYDPAIYGSIGGILSKIEENKDKSNLRATHQLADINQVVDLHGRLYKQEYGWGNEFKEYVVKTFKEFKPKRDQLWVAEKNGEVVGSIGIVTHSTEEAQLRWFLVDPRTRGEGVGKDLLKLAIRYCKYHGFKSVFLETTKDLETAAHLYRSAGFQLTGEETPKEMWGKTVVEQRYDLSF